MYNYWRQIIIFGRKPFLLKTVCITFIKWTSLSWRNYHSILASCADFPPVPNDFQFRVNGSLRIRKWSAAENERNNFLIDLPFTVNHFRWNAFFKSHIKQTLFLTCEMRSQFWERHVCFTWQKNNNLVSPQLNCSFWATMRCIVISWSGKIVKSSLEQQNIAENTKL